MVSTTKRSWTQTSLNKRMTNRIRTIKGGLLFVAFLVVAVSIYFQPELGTISHITEFGLSPTFMVSGFLFAAVSSLYTGLKHLKWNIIIYTPFMFYTGATWEAVIAGGGSRVPVAGAAFYTLLLVFMLIDWYQDVRA